MQAAIILSVRPWLINGSVSNLWRTSFKSVFNTCTCEKSIVVVVGLDLWLFCASQVKTNEMCKGCPDTIHHRLTPTGSEGTRLRVGSAARRLIS